MPLLSNMQKADFLMRQLILLKGFTGGYIVFLIFTQNMIVGNNFIRSVFLAKIRKLL